MNSFVQSTFSHEWSRTRLTQIVKEIEDVEFETLDLKFPNGKKIK